jgi:hypothetical protein
MCSSVACALAFAPRLLFSLQRATANPNDHLGDAMVHAAPFLFGSCMAPLLAVVAGLLALVFAFSAMRKGDKLLGRISLFMLLLLLVFEYQKLRIESRDLPPAQDFGPRDKECEAAALSGNPCNSPSGPSAP